MLATYRSILREPGAPRLVITALLGRIPVGINALAIVLLVRRATGSFTDAGIVDAGLALGSAFLSPVQGRLVDRFGQPRLLIPSALISAAALIGLDVAAHRHVGIVLLTALAAIGGGTLPPMSASMRALWAFLIPEPQRRDSAFALEAVLTEVYFIAGPLLTAAIIAVSSPSAAIVTSVCLTVVGTIAFATSRPSRRWRAAKAKRTFAGPLAGPGMRTLVLSVLPMGLAFGILEVTMPALATQNGDPAAAGILLGAFAGGSLLGGLLYGSRTWRGSLRQRYIFLTAMFAAGMAPLIIAGAIPVMAVLMAVAGLTLAPVAACAFALIEEVAPPGTTTEAFTWVFTANMTGAAAGAAIAGPVIHSSGIRAALLIPVAGVAASLLLALARRGTLTPLEAGAGSAAEAERGLVDVSTTGAERGHDGAGTGAPRPSSD
ncbi:MAG: MFS transporter [Actinomycetota bacterium]|nr:MFS transporter [Actinomycetota bacterium]